MTRGMGSHQSRFAADYSDEWYTPRHIIDALGPFDLDPCSPLERPFDTAGRYFTIKDNGLAQSWKADRVWLNPPYGDKTALWLKRLAFHGRGVALVFARTETKAFFDFVWPYASGLLFLAGRIDFISPKGRGRGHSGAPSVLIAYDTGDQTENADALRRSGLKGAFVPAATPTAEPVDKRLFAGVS